MANPKHATKGPRKLILELPKEGKVQIMTNEKVRKALAEIQTDLDLYNGVRLLQVIEAVYVQGKKDGKEEVLDQVQRQTRELDRQMRPKRIGRPPKAKQRHSR